MSEGKPTRKLRRSFTNILLHSVAPHAPNSELRIGLLKVGQNGEGEPGTSTYTPKDGDYIEEEMLDIARGTMVRCYVITNRAWAEVKEGVLLKFKDYWLINCMGDLHELDITKPILFYTELNSVKVVEGSTNPVAARRTVEKIRQYGFTCEGGYLEYCQDYQDLLRLAGLTLGEIGRLESIKGPKR